MTVTPSGPTSRASVFAQPITPGRTEFESARLSIGSRTELDVMLMMRPCPLRRSCGRQRFVRRIADSSRSSTALSTASSVRSTAVPGRSASVVDQDVDPAEGFDRLLDESLEILRVRQVAADRQRAEPLGLALKDVAPAGEHRDVGALGGERLGDREPHSGGGAADDCGLSFEPEVHALARRLP